MQAKLITRFESLNKADEMFWNINDKWGLKDIYSIFDKKVKI